MASAAFVCIFAPLYLSIYRYNSILRGGGVEENRYMGFYVLKRDQSKFYMLGKFLLYFLSLRLGKIKSNLFQGYRPRKTADEKVSVYECCSNHEKTVFRRHTGLLRFQS
jgi:hypothetical protein